MYMFERFYLLARMQIEHNPLQNAIQEALSFNAIYAETVKKTII